MRTCQKPIYYTKSGKTRVTFYNKCITHLLLRETSDSVLTRSVADNHRMRLPKRPSVSASGLWKMTARPG